MSDDFRIGDKVYFKDDARKSPGCIEGMMCSMQCGGELKVEYDVHWVEFERELERERERLLKEDKTLICSPPRKFKADELIRMEAAR
jgi:hypothetical protein